MGRWSTGAISTGQCLKVPISSFTEYIKKGITHLQGSISYEGGASIGVKLIKVVDSYEVELFYTKTVEGEKKDISYRISIVSVPSNLGKGEVYYFRCPFSFVKCKTLYMGYGSLYFKSRKAYRHRIYYASQLSSRLDKHNDKYWSLEKKLKTLYPKHPKQHYRGKPTKAQKRINFLEQKQQYHEEMRWRVLPVAVLKSMASYGFTDPKDLF